MKTITKDMKKLMFSDRCGLTRAVLERRKTMTRRPVPIGLLKKAGAYRARHSEDTHESISEKDALLELSPFKVGEVVSVAQSYHALNKAGFVAPEWCEHTCENSPGYSNKMFVRADLMPHQIRITNVRVERLQDISDEDCLREGIIGDKQALLYGFRNGKHYETYFSPRKAFADLINKTSGKGTWDSNPYCFCYAFELIK